MIILVLNCGSSSLKYQVLNMKGDNDFDLFVFLMIDDLSELTDPYYHNDLEKLLNTGGGFCRTLTKFNYCPDCGAKIDWDKIEADLLTNKK